MCIKCKNMTWITEDEIKFHIYHNGIVEAYTIGYLHDEKVEQHDHYAVRTGKNHNVNDDEDMYDIFEILRDIEK